MMCAPQPYRIMRKMIPAQITKYKTFSNNCMTPNSGCWRLIAQFDHIMPMGPQKSWSDDTLIDFMARSPIDGERAENIRLSTRQCVDPDQQGSSERD